MHKILNLLGLATRAKKVINGEAFCLEAIKKGEVRLIFLASDAGVNTTKRITDKANFYHVPIMSIFTSSELSKAIGKENRMVIGVIDAGFAKKMKEIGDLNGKS